MTVIFIQLGAKM